VREPEDAEEPATGEKDGGSERKDEPKRERKAGLTNARRAAHGAALRSLSEVPADDQGLAINTG
jgi:hypothetical protein